MSFRFRKVISAGPIKLNIGKKSASVSVGRRGAWLNFGSKGIRSSVGIPGTGMSYTSKVASWNNSNKSSGSKQGIPFYIWFLVVLGGILMPSCTFITSCMIISQCSPQKKSIPNTLNVPSVVSISQSVPTFQIPAKPIETTQIEATESIKPISKPKSFAPKQNIQYVQEPKTVSVHCCDGTISGCSCGQTKGCCSKHKGVCGCY